MFSGMSITSNVLDVVSIRGKITVEVKDARLEKWLVPAP